MSASTCMSTSTSATLDRKAARGHWLPFAVWMGGMLLLQVLAEVATLPRWAAPVVYAAKSLLCAALLLRDRPWRLYTGMRIADWVPAAAAGLVVAAIWIVPETPLAGRVFPSFQTFYHRWLILPPGRLPSYFDPATFPALPFNHPSLAFSPAEAGWALVGAKLLGSAFVIAVIEEYFFRGFLYRWIRNADFRSITLGRYDAAAFWLVVLLFGLEHDRWLAGLIAGAVYGALAVRTGRVAPAVTAHVVTNLVLGLYVIATGQYGFW